MNKYNQYIYKDGQWRLIGTSATSDSDNAKVKSYVETVEEENTFYASISDIDRINALLDDDAALLRDANPTPEDPTHSLLNYQGTFKQWLEMWDVEVLDDYFNYLDDMGYNWGTPLYSTPNENITHTIGEGAEAVTYNLNWLSTVSSDHTMTGFIGTTPFTLNIVTDSETGGRTIAVTMGDEDELKNPSVFLYKNGEVFNLALKDSNDFANVYFKNPIDINIEKNSINLYDKYIDDERGKFILEHPDLMLQSYFPEEARQEGVPLTWEEYASTNPGFKYPAMDTDVLRTWINQLSMEQWKNIIKLFLEQFPSGISTNSDINFTIEGTNYNFNYIWSANINPDNTNQFRIEAILPINSEQGWRKYDFGCYEEDGKTWTVNRQSSHIENNATYSDRINYLTTNTDISTFSNSVTTWEETINAHFLITEWVDAFFSANIDWEEIYNNGVPKNNPTMNCIWNEHNLNWLYDLEYLSDWNEWQPYGLFIINNKLYYFDKITISDSYTTYHISPYPNDILKNVVVFSDKDNNIKMYSFGDSEEGNQYVKKTGDTMTGNLNIVNGKSLNVGDVNNLTNPRLSSLAVGGYESDPNGEMDPLLMPYPVAALGASSIASGAGSVALGTGAVATGLHTLAGGSGAHVEGIGSFANSVNVTSYNYNNKQYKVEFVEQEGGEGGYYPSVSIGQIVVYSDQYSSIRNAIITNVTYDAETSQPIFTTDKNLERNSSSRSALSNSTVYITESGAIGAYSHAEGYQTTAIGTNSHAEGRYAIASGNNSHAEGFYTTAQRKSQHTEGEYNILDSSGTTSTRGTYVHIIGNGTSNNTRSNAATIAWDGTAWFQGDVYTGSTSGTNKDSGSKKLATEDFVTSKGYITTDTKNTAGSTDTSSKIYLIGAESQAANPQTYSDNEIYVQDGALNAQELTIGTRVNGSTIGEKSSAEGNLITASGQYSHAEGIRSTASGQSSHAEGVWTTSSTTSAHAEGASTNASGQASHAEGSATTASGAGSHSEGGTYLTGIALTGTANSTTYTTTYTTNMRVGDIISFVSSQMPNPNATTTSGVITAIVEGTSVTLNRTINPSENWTNKTCYLYSVSTASGKNSHVEGSATTASGEASHAEGIYTIANGVGQHVEGKFNIADSSSLHIVGRGSSNQNRSNAYTLSSNGTAWFAGDVYVGSTGGKNKDTGSKKLATEDYVTTSVASAISDITSIDYQVVASLPAEGIKGIIYLVSNSEGSPNLYDEYIWINNQFEKLGYAVPVINTITPAAIDAIFTD